MERRSCLMPRRLQKDVAELWENPYSCNGTSVSLEAPTATADAYQLQIKIAVHEGPYAGGHFRFMLRIPAQYPFKGPVISALMPIWHPNIDLHTRRVLLPVVHEDWSPVVTLNSTCFALQMLLLEPNPDYSVNDAASESYRSARDEFEKQVQSTLVGGCFWGVFFPSHTIREKRKNVEDDMSSTSAYETGDEVKEGIEGMRLQGPNESEDVAPSKRVRHCPDEYPAELRFAGFPEGEHRRHSPQPMFLQAPHSEEHPEPSLQPESQMMLSALEQFEPVYGQPTQPSFEVSASPFSWSRS